MPAEIKCPAGAFWIGSDHAFDLAETYLNFRLDLDLATVPAEAIFTLTADSRYRVWVNGRYAGRGPSRCWPWAQAMDTIDIASLLRVGRNQIAVQVYSPGYSHFAYVHRGAAGFLGWVMVNGALAAVSDQSWRVRRDGSWLPLVPRISIYGAGVEQRDMLHDTDWQTQHPADWAVPRLVAPPESPIWSGLHARNVAPLAEDKQILATPWQTRFGQATAPALADPHQDLRRDFGHCPTGPVPANLRAGDTAIWVFDLGHSQVCVAGAQIDGVAVGDTLTISYAEKLRDGDLVLSDPDTYCRMRPTDIYHLRHGAQLAEPFSQRGARYVVYRLQVATACTPKLEFYVRTTSAALAEKPVLTPDDPALADVAAMCARTIRTCLQDGFVDSIWRESSQWLGDVVAEAFALQGISDDPRPLAQTILMAEQGAQADAILPSVLPSETHAYVVTDYNFAWIELLRMYLTHPGAPDAANFVAARMPALTRMIARFQTDLIDGLLHAQPGRRLFLDWSAQDRREPNLTYNLRFLHGLQTAARLARAVNHHDHSAQWDDQAKQVQAAIRKHFHQHSGWQDSPNAAKACQLSLALLILTNCASDNEAQVLAEQIIARSLDLDDSNTPDKLVLASPFMHHYLFLALEHIGRQDAILAIIRARWGRWAKAGEATTWENWNVDFPDGSVCHGFSAHPLGWLTHILSL